MVLRWIVALVAVLALAGGAGLAFLELDSLGAARNRIAAAVLSAYTGERVTVTGPVTVALGSSTTVSVEGVRPVGAGEGSRDQGLRMRFPLSEALRGRLRPTSVAVSGVKILLDRDQRAEDVSLGKAVEALVTGFLRGAFSGDLTFENVTVAHSHDPEGWDFSLRIDRAMARDSETTDVVDIAMLGSVNEQPFTLSAHAPRPAAQDRAVLIELRMAGLDASLDGTLSHDAEGARLAGTVVAESKSVGDLLVALGLAREAEGTATLEATLTGPLAQLSLSSASLEMRLSQGPVATVAGSVGDIWTGDGLDLNFALTEIAGADAPLLVPRTIDGRLTGDAAAMEIEELAIETGLASVDLQRIGPVSVAQVARDPQGRVRLDGVRLVQGDPAAPAIEFRGSLADLFAFRGVEASARFRLDLASLFGLRGDVGAIDGALSMSDRGGALRLAAFEAETLSDSPIGLALRLRDDGRLAVGLGVPDLGRFAEAAGLEAAAEGGALAFDGVLGLRGEALDVDGELTVGESTLDADLAFGVSRSGIAVIGSLRSDRLHLASFREAHEAAGIAAGLRLSSVTIEPAVARAATADLDFAAGAVSGLGVHDIVADLSAQISLTQAEIRVDPFAARAFGGALHGAVSALLDAMPPQLSIDATARGVDAAVLSRQLAGRAAIAGPLDLDVALHTRSGDPASMLAALSGAVSASMRGGRLGDDMLNLAGESILSWLATRRPDGSAELVCLVASLDFDDGIATVRNLILETDKVQMVTGGTLDLRRQTISLVAAPRAKAAALVGSVGPVSIEGPLASPAIRLEDGAVAGKLIGDTLGLPLRLLENLLPLRAPQESGEPCIISHEDAGR